jgi:hypothetical protein
MTSYKAMNKNRKGKEKKIPWIKQTSFLAL